VRGCFFVSFRKKSPPMKDFPPLSRIQDRTTWPYVPKELKGLNQNERAERLVADYADTILRMSYTYLKNTADAQDVCQEVLIKLMQEERTFESAEHEKAFVLRVTANACKDVLKSVWHKRVCGLEACAETPAPPEPENEVLSAVNTLSAKYRAVIYLYYYEGYHAEEIGRILGMPAATVHTRLARGREKLKWILEGAAYGRQTV
jgi:RNA polymerase sigma factor (sigma-70 family)